MNSTRMVPPVAWAAVGWLALSVCQSVMAANVYTCVDARGRKLTSDRPIVECIDREQLEISPSGVIVRRIPPSLTAAERAAIEERERAQAEAKARAEEQRRRDRALLIRYPRPEVLENERREALAQVDHVIEAARERLSELQRERKALEAEREFYLKDPSRMPPALRRQLEDNTQAIAAQERFILDKQEEKKRIDERFDADRQRLRPLWAGSAAAAAPSSR